MRKPRSIEKLMVIRVRIREHDVSDRQIDKMCTLGIVLKMYKNWTGFIIVEGVMTVRTTMTTYYSHLQ